MAHWRCSPGCSVSGELDLWHLVVLAAVYGAASAFFMPAFDAIVPDASYRAAPDRGERARPVRAAGDAVAAGPGAGRRPDRLAGAGWAFALDAATFGISSLCLLRLTRLPVARTEALTVRAVRSLELREGFSFVRAEPWLWATSSAATLTYLLFLGPTEVLLPYLVKNELGGDAHDLGMVLAAGGVAALVTAFVDRPDRAADAGRMTFTYLAWTLATLAVAGYGLAHTRWQAMGAAALVSGFETLGAVAWTTTKQRLVPAEMLGRVSSFDWFLSITLVPVSYALTAPVAAVAGVRPTLVGAGVLGALVTFGFLFVPGVRDPDRCSEPAEPAEPAEPVVPVPS